MRPRRCCRLVAASVLVVLGAAVLHAFDKADRERAKEMVESIKSVIKDSYYDPHYQGINLDAHFAAVRTRLDGVDSFGQAFAVIAQSLLDFQDSHTFFLPPALSTTFDYGWKMQAIGDRCFVVAVNPGSDAAAKGLRPGDQLLRIQRTTPTRHTMWRTKYLFYSLYPQPAVKVRVRRPDGEQREFDIEAAIATRPRVIEIGPEDLNQPMTLFGEESRVERESVRIRTLALWKLPTFEFPAGEVDRLFDGATTQASTLVLDLRGNSGGFIETLERIAGRLFDREVTLATRVGRRPMPPMLATPRRPFTGPVIVLVDSDTSSAAEILARAIQIERRGIVIGDRSAGRVMQSHVVPVPLTERGIMTIFYVHVTDADVIMTDGMSLEHTGIVPDEVVLPTAADLAQGRDPVLARAAALHGVTLDPAAAHAMFPVEWK